MAARQLLGEVTLRKTEIHDKENFLYGVGMGFWRMKFPRLLTPCPPSINPDTSLKRIATRWKHGFLKNKRIIFRNPWAEVVLLIAVIRHRVQ